MAGSYLLDTNIVIRIFNGRISRSRLSSGSGFFCSTIVLGELYFGARKSHRVEDNLARIDRFKEDVPILGCDSPTADRYGVVKLQLRRKGRPIPENDIWIAAMAIRHGLELVTDDRHFAEIEELKTVKW